MALSHYEDFASISQMQKNIASHWFVLRSSVYMDDVVAGANDKAEACELQDQLIGHLVSGQFELRKWASNCPKLLKRVDSSFPMDTNDHNLSVKIFGLRWMPEEDAFSFLVQSEP